MGVYCTSDPGTVGGYHAQIFPRCYFFGYCRVQPFFYTFGQDYKLPLGQMSSSIDDFWASVNPVLPRYHKRYSCASA
jgi:hypothetical protein